MAHQDQPPSSKPTADCYSAGDRRFMLLTQRLRAIVLNPVLRLLTACHVTADGITVLSLLAGLAGCLLFFSSKPLFLGLILLHVVLDGVDGPLARHQGTASRKGSFTDTMSDQIVVAGSTAVLMVAGIIGVVPGVTYVFVYTIVIAFSMVRNALSVPYSWLLRPRFVVYVWFAVEFYLWPGTINVALWILIGLLLLKMASGFYRIRKAL